MCRVKPSHWFHRNYHRAFSPDALDSNWGIFPIGMATCHRPQSTLNKQLLQCRDPRRGDGDRGVRVEQFKRSPRVYRSCV